MAIEHVRSWKIGDVTVSRIVELWKFTDHINMTIADAAPEEVVAMRWLHPHYATPDGEQIMNFQGFLVQAPGLNLMLDTCIGNGRDRAFDVFRNLDTSFIADLASLGVAPEQVDVVLCTHLHFDHVGWNTYWDGAQWAPTFPNARYLFGRTEYDAWEAMRAEEDHGLHDVRHLADAVDPIMARGLATLIDAHHRISEELWTEPSHGHSPGHIHLCIESKGERGVITGDLMHHPIGQNPAMAIRRATSISASNRRASAASSPATSCTTRSRPRCPAARRASTWIRGGASRPASISSSATGTAACW